MALFRRKEKEQLLVPHSSVEHPHVAAPVEAPIAPTPEVQKQVEQQQPAPAEQQRPVEVPRPGASAQTQTQAAPAPAPQAVQPKTPVRQNIESVLSSGLTEVYQGMTPEEQQQFRVAGEEAASTIEQLMTGFKATARVVLDVIRNWLMMIPRVNKYFLEQESKIKTDQIIVLQRKLKKTQHNTHIHME